MSECNPDDCLSIPFPRKCVEYCIEQVLRVARPNEKIEILEMDEDLARAIFDAYNTGTPITSFDDLRAKLTLEQITSIKTTFDNLTQAQLDYFIPRMN